MGPALFLRKQRARKDQNPLRLREPLSLFPPVPSSKLQVLLLNIWLHLLQSSTICNYQPKQWNRHTERNLNSTASKGPNTSSAVRAPKAKSPSSQVPNPCPRSWKSTNLPKTSYCRASGLKDHNSRDLGLHELYFEVAWM